MTISPGWYPDPAEPSTQRYWDGDGWIGAPISVDAVPPATPSLLPATPVVPGPVQPVAVAKGSRAPARPHGLPLATPGARAVARLIDTAVLIGLNILVNGWFVYLWLKDFVPFWQNYTNRVLAGQDTDDLKAPERLDTLMFVIVLIGVALWFAYEVPSIAFRGQTLGKRMAGIKSRRRGEPGAARLLPVLAALEHPRAADAAHPLSRPVLRVPAGSGRSLHSWSTKFAGWHFMIVQRVPTWYSSPSYIRRGTSHDRP